MIIKNCKITNYYKVSGPLTVNNAGVFNNQGTIYNGCVNTKAQEEEPEKADVETAEMTETRTIKVTRPASNGNAGNKNNGIVVTNSQFEEKVLELLDTLMAGKTNKDAATIINGALSAGAILKPTHGEFCARYGVDILGEKLFYKYVGLDKMAITKVEIEPIKEMFKKLLS